MRDIIVLSGGASVMDYNIRGIENRGQLIAVNDAALFTKCAVAFTMDRLWLEGRQLLLKVLCPPSIFYRANTAKNFVPPHEWVMYDHEEKEPVGMSRTHGKLNGSNSGTCALNLAFQYRPPRVFLLGFDMQYGPAGEKHWYPDYPWNNGGGTKKGKLGEWSKEFDIIAKQFKEEGIEVLNVNHRSLIKAFKTITFKDFERMT